MCPKWGAGCGPRPGASGRVLCQTAQRLPTPLDSCPTWAARVRVSALVQGGSDPASQQQKGSAERGVRLCCGRTWWRGPPCVALCGPCCSLTCTVGWALGCSGPHMGCTGHSSREPCAGGGEWGRSWPVVSPPPLHRRAEAQSCTAVASHLFGPMSCPTLMRPRWFRGLGPRCGPAGQRLELHHSSGNGTAERQEVVGPSSHSWGGCGRHRRLGTPRPSGKRKS